MKGSATEGLLVTGLFLIFGAIISNIVSLASSDLAGAKIAATVLSSLAFVFGNKFICF